MSERRRHHPVAWRRHQSRRQPDGRPSRHGADPGVTAFFSLAPLLRGEGWGEGLTAYSGPADTPPHPHPPSRSDPPPQPGRGSPAPPPSIQPPPSPYFSNPADRLSHSLT